MPVSIRPFRPSDAPACGRIVDATPLWRRYGLTGGALARALVASTEPIFVADDAGVVLGFAWVLRSGAFGRSGYLRLIAVDPDRRGARVGEELLRAFEAEAQSRSADAFLLVSDFNAGARRFYLREGYVEVGRLDDYVVPGVSEILMRKRLGRPAAPDAGAASPADSG